MRSLVLNAIGFFVLIMGPLETYSQKMIEDIKISTWYGTREITCANFPATSNLDFMEYLDANSEYPEDDYAGLATRIKFKGNWEADLRFTVNSGWRPSGFTVKVNHFPFKYLGLSAGIFGYPYYINAFDLYHTSRDLEYYTDIRHYSTHKQRLVSDIGIFTGLVIPLHFKFLHSILQLNGGISSFSKFSESFGQKRINSNLKREIFYDTQNSFSWFLMPEAVVYIDLIKMKNLRFGIQTQMSWYTTNKYVNYQRTISTWTSNNPVVEQIKNPKHPLKKFEFNVGTYFRW